MLQLHVMPLFTVSLACHNLLINNYQITFYILLSTYLNMNIKIIQLKKNALRGLKYVDTCVPVFLFFRTHTYTKDFMVFNQFRTSYIPADSAIVTPANFIYY